jgi:hypothetical protein
VYGRFYSRLEEDKQSGSRLTGGCLERRKAFDSGIIGAQLHSWLTYQKPIFAAEVCCPPVTNRVACDRALPVILVRGLFTWWWLQK